MTDTFKETFEFSAETVKDIADGYVTLAYRGKDGLICCNYEDNHDLLPLAIALSMARDQGLRSIIIKSVVLFAKEQGNVIEIKAPEDPSLN